MFIFLLTRALFFWMFFKRPNVKLIQCSALSLGAAVPHPIPTAHPSIDRFIKAVLKIKPPRFPVSKLNLNLILKAFTWPCLELLSEPSYSPCIDSLRMHTNQCSFTSGVQVYSLLHLICFSVLMIHCNGCLYFLLQC